MWRDLISGNYENYALLDDDDSYEECYNWFWTSINLDETLPKEFLEYLHQLMDDIDSGKVETVPMTLEELNRISDILNQEEEDGDV
jgi:hypothetical protein